MEAIFLENSFRRKTEFPNFPVFLKKREKTVLKFSCETYDFRMISALFLFCVFSGNTLIFLSASNNHCFLNLSIYKFVYKILSYFMISPWNRKKIIAEFIFSCFVCLLWLVSERPMSRHRCLPIFGNSVGHSLVRVMVRIKQSFYNLIINF